MSAWLASRSKQDIAELMTDTEKMNFDTSRYKTKHSLAGTSENIEIWGPTSLLLNWALPRYQKISDKYNI